MGAFLRQLLRLHCPCGNVARFYSSPSTTRILRCKLLVVGGGTGGCSVAWRFARKLKSKDIVILEPSEYHYYQPLFTLIAAGIKQPQQACRSLLSVIPPGACWLRAQATCFEPDHCVVHTDCGDVIQYDYMVVALGLKNDYDAIPGLKECLTDPTSGTSTIYSPNYCSKTWNIVQNYGGGHAVFTFPKQPGKCAGAAQKIMYLADDYWRRKKKRDSVSISYHTAGESLFGVPKYGAALSKVVKSRDIAICYRSDLVEVRPNIAVFQVGEEKLSVPYTFLHVTPPMSVPGCLRGALAGDDGFLTVDRHTLQHTKYPNVYGLGDCTNTPNSKTAAAVAPQSYVVEQNLTATMSGKAPPAKYDGYGSCPMLTSYRRGILAEFTYDKTVCETFPFDQSKERRLFYFMKTSYFPYLYWNKLIKGKWNGPKRIRKIINPLGR